MACCGLTLAASIALAAWGLAPRTAEAGDELAALEAQIARTYGHVRHLGPDGAQRYRDEAPDQIVLFDVREAAEFEVGRIAGAVRVDPGVRAAAFLSEHGARLTGKTVVFYCAVGVRSSKLAGRLTEALYGAGVRRVYNLSGGIFRWHNEGRPVVDARGGTAVVHPYNAYWGRYVTRAGATSLTPASAR